MKRIVFPKYLLGALFYTLLGGFLNGQELYKIAPPSPETAALTKYGDIPVSTYTGVPNINIPIYTIRSRDITVPISMSYHASGIKVNEEASWVGLGWALNAGGLISRTIMGGNDFIDGYFGSESLIVEDISNVDVFDQPFSIFYPISYQQNTCEVQLINGNYDLSENKAGEVIDQENLQNAERSALLSKLPDQYRYNFLGYSGKFALSPMGEVIFGQPEKIEFIPDSPTYNTFFVRTPNGFRYEFSDVELREHKEGTWFRVAWYLSKIISPTGNTVTFHYSEDLPHTTSLGTLYQSMGGVNQEQTSYFEAPPLYRMPVLDSIVYETGKVVFISDMNRDDLETGRRLTAVEIYARGEGGGYTYHKSFRLNQSYFDYDVIGPYDTYPGLTYSDEAILYKRLRLDGIQELYDATKGSLGAEEKGAYVFSYYEEGKNILPAKTSPSRDYWNYYNGKGNSTLVPRFSGYLFSEGAEPELTSFDGANRNPDSAYTRAFSLKEIKYPTGGTTTFAYENNTYDYEKSVENDLSILNHCIPEDTAIGFVNTDIGIEKSHLLDLTDLFVQPGEVLGKLHLNASFLCPTVPCSEVVGDAYFALFDTDNNPVSQVSLAEVEECDPICTYSNTYFIEPGIYTWKSRITTGIINTISANYSYQKKECQNGLKVGPGLRISEIMDAGGDPHSPNISRSFLYHGTGADGDIFSYGRLMRRPRFAHQDLVLDIQCPSGGTNLIIGYMIPTFNEESEFTGHVRIGDIVDSPPGGGCTQVYKLPLFMLSESIYGIGGGSSGMAIGYDQVSIVHGKEGQTLGTGGKSTFQYENQPDIVFSYPGLRPPSGFSSLANNRNGLLQRQTDYKFAGGSQGRVDTGVEGFSPVRQIVNEYAVNTKRELVYGLDLSLRPPEDLGRLGTYIYLCDEGKKDIFLHPLLISENLRLTSTTETLYGTEGGNPITTTTRFTYEPEGDEIHYQMLSQETVNSDGLAYGTRYFYPSDYGSTGIYGNMQDRFMYSLPVEMIQYRGGNAISAVKTEYGLEEDNVVVKKVHKSRNQGTFHLGPGSAPYEARVEIDAYDEKGNILIQHLTGDKVAKYYLYGNNKNLPVAEITATIGAKDKAGLLSLMDRDVIRSGNDAAAIYALLQGQFGEKAFIFAYGYNEQLRLATSTDPNGRTTSYAYDGLGRLIEIKDHNGHIVQEMEYNYGND